MLRTLREITQREQSFKYEYMRLHDLDHVRVLPPTTAELRGKVDSPSNMIVPLFSEFSAPEVVRQAPDPMREGR